jgi:chromosome segregation ATPase
VAEPILDPPATPTPQAERAAAAAAGAEPIALSTPPPAAPSGEAQALRENLELERQRRRTLEQEIERLGRELREAEKFRAAWNELQAARAEILVLGTKLAEERERRESLELQVEQARRRAGAARAEESLPKLLQLLEERRQESERLAAALREANEAIVRLRGQLESAGSSEENARVLARLEEENRSLRAELQQARADLARLSERAALAERLAELVYSNPR